MLLRTRLMELPVVGNHCGSSIQQLVYSSTRQYDDRDANSNIVEKARGPALLTLRELQHHSVVD